MPLIDLLLCGNLFAEDPADWQRQIDDLKTEVRDLKEQLRRAQAATLQRDSMGKVLADVLYEVAPAEMAGDMPDGDASAQYDQISSLESNKEYDKLIRACEFFIQMFPADKLVDDVNYKMAYAMYMQKDYASAKKHLLNLYTKEPKTYCSYDALLLVGRILEEEKKPERACIIYQSLDKQKPPLLDSSKETLKQLLMKCTKPCKGKQS